ncbi:Hypothetical predicted protein [Mytilus galloprovincialis]|uniref:Mutator-like transposase domain-containing protein n=1 Tax=Mytilus galloprovincialis TaxID=29158 RepID=A0A8B6DED4_MYTGA|nr:Hypothetical predicted protein [Mytilus galloprovincialis]
MRGHQESHIDVEGDGCYSNPLYSGIGKTPFQPATQSCYVVVENMTDKKLVINLVTKNKLCSHGKDHSNENITNKNCKCTQNLQMVESIGNEHEVQVRVYPNCTCTVRVLKLGPKELERTKLGTNTQKSECVNRIIRRSLPRSNTFSKNFQGRANSAVSSANHGPGESVMALCLSVGAPVTAGSKVHTHLQQEQKNYENHKQYKKLSKYMKNRKQKAKAKFELYSKNQEVNKYEKGMLLKSQKKYSTKTGRHSKR